jgi:hypothetical protein
MLPGRRDAVAGRAHASHVACLLIRALDWIELHLSDFDPQTEEGSVDALRNKALAELAFLGECLCRALPAERPRSQRILSFVAKVWERPEYQDLILSSAPMIQRVVDAGYALALEAVPFRMMDLRHVLDHAAIHHALPAMKDLFVQTMLAQRPPIYYLTSADVYCLTHTIFYLTDFGFETSDVIERSILSSYRRMIEHLLGLYVRLSDWDLTAELLICAHCLKSPSSEVQSAAMQAITAAQLEDGSVPAPKFDLRSEDARRAGVRYVFEHNYHTTLVSALAAALCA